MRNSFKVLMLLLLMTVLLPVYQAAAVELNPGYIAGRLSVNGYTPTTISTNASGGGYTASKYTYNNSDYLLTVQGGTWNYTFTTSAGLTGPNITSLTMNFNNRTLVVPPGQTVTNDYVYNTGTIRYQVTITGDPSTGATVPSAIASKSVTTGEKTYTSASSTLFTTRSFTWDIPVVANQQISLSADVRVTGSTGSVDYIFSNTAAAPYYLPLQDVAPGQVVVIPLNINFVAPTSGGTTPPPATNTGTLAGNVYLAYAPLALQKHSVSSNNVTANPGTYSQLYSFYGSYTNQYVYPPNTYFDTTIDSTLRWPYNNGVQNNNYARLNAGQTTYMDFERSSGILTGRVNFSGTVKNEDLKAWTFGLNGQGTVYDSQGHSTVKDTNYANVNFRRDTVGTQYKKPTVRDYKLVMVAGDWNLGQLSLEKKTTTTYTKSSAVNFYDYTKMYDGKTYLGTPTHIDAGATLQKDFNFCFGSAIIRFRDLSGKLLSTPSMYGSGSHTTNGVVDTNISLFSGSSTITNAETPEVELFGPTGDYTLTNIQIKSQDGTTITFPPMNLSMTCNTTKEIPIPGPTLIVTSPRAELVVDQSEVLVTGSAFGDYPIAAITINGVDLNTTNFKPVKEGVRPNEVSFSYPLALTPGLNIITVSATDTNSQRATEQLQVFSESWPPTVIINNPLEQPYLNTLPIPIQVQASDQGYGYTLRVFLDDKEIYFGEGRENILAPDTLTYNGFTPSLEKGSHKVRAVVVDKTGKPNHTAVAERTFTVYSNDNTPPVVTAPPDVTVYAVDTLTAVQIGTATATDDVGVVSLVNNAPAAYPLGPTTVTWTAKDAAGNSASAEQRITVLCVAGLLSPGDYSVASRTALAAANSSSTQPYVDGSGRFVAFSSYASNLVAGDTNGQRDVFLKDLQNDVVTRVSVGTGGTELNGQSGTPYVTPDGKYVSFSSAATNVVPNSTGIIYRHNTVTKETLAVPNSRNGGEMTADGRYIVYTDLAYQAYLYDFTNNTAVLISKAADGTPANSEVKWPTITPDGRYIGFSSSASNLVANDSNNVGDVFIYDQATGTLERVSVTDAGLQGNGESQLQAWEGRKGISDDGRYVVFTSWATNLTAESDANNAGDIYIHDRHTHTTRLVSVSLSGTTGSAHSEYASISGNGRFVTFKSLSGNLVTTPFMYSVGRASYVRDLTVGRTEAISLCSTGQICTGEAPVINFDGSVIAFESYVNLGAYDTSAYDDIFLVKRRDMCPAVAVDNPPTINAPPDIEVEATGPWTKVILGTPTVADDNGVPSFTNDAPADSMFPIFSPHQEACTTKVKWTVKDSIGQSADDFQNVTIVDTTPPKITVPKPIHVPLKSPLTDQRIADFLNGGRAEDLVDENLPVVATISPSDLLTITAKDQPRIVTFSATDGHNNTGSDTSSITVTYGCGETRINGESVDFLTPVSLLKSFQHGSTIPIKLRVCDGLGAPVPDAVVRIVLHPYLGETPPPTCEPIYVTSSMHEEDDLFKYQPSGDEVLSVPHYHYNLDTKDLELKNYWIEAVLNDNTSRFIRLFLKDGPNH